MKIAVLVKQVPGSESPLPLNSSATWLEEDKVTFEMNESDNYALEEALQIQERVGSGEVVVVSLGPPRVQKIIREALAKGAARGIHIEEETEAESDPLTIARLFAGALEGEGFDLILSGLQSDDLGQGQTGIILGELLGMATASLVMATELADGAIRVKRELEAGWFQWVSLPLPVSLSIQSGINQPRYPSLRGIMGARKKELRVISKADLSPGPAGQSLSRLFVPRKTKRTEMITGETDKVVARLVEIMQREVKVI